MRVLRTDLPTFAFSVGFWPLEAIVLGRYAKHLSAREVDAIIAHERGHIEHRHALRRLAWLLTGRWAHLSDACKRQELEADAYAVNAGHADGLLVFLSRCTEAHESALHPTPRRRIAAITSLLGESHAAQ